jgi:hypothetical protein
MVHALFLLVAVLVDFFFSRSSKSQKKSVAKKLGMFDIRKVPGSQKHEKTRKFAS